MNTESIVMLERAASTEQMILAANNVAMPTKTTFGQVTIEHRSTSARQRA